MEKRKGVKVIHTILPYFILALAIFMTLLPVFSMILTSLKTQREIMSSGDFFPNSVSFENYIKTIQKSNFLVYIRNSLMVAITVSVVSTVFAILGGYALSRYRNKVKGLKAYTTFLLVLQMFPVVQLIIPLYLNFQRVGITNTRLSVIVAYLTFTLPLNIWMMQSFFDGIPIEMEESGRIDGCGRFQTLVLLVAPVAGPGIASVGIFAFNYCWNEYLIGSLLLKRDGLRTLTIGLQNFMQENTTDWGSLMAASTMSLIPVLIFLIFMQKNIVSGMTAGAVKG